MSTSSAVSAAFPVPATSRRSEAARRAILIAAFELAGEVGYAGLTMEGIAARAGVGKQTVYRWWSSKGAVLLDSCEAVSPDDPDEIELPDTGNIDADLRAAVRATVDELTDPRYELPLRTLTAAMMTDDDLTALYIARIDAPRREKRKHRLSTARTAGQLPETVDLDLAVDMLWGPITTRWVDASAPLTHDYADAVVTTALAGLRLRRKMEP